MSPFVICAADVSIVIVVCRELLSLILSIFGSFGCGSIRLLHGFEAN